MGQRLAVNSFTVVNGSSTAKSTCQSQRHSWHALGHPISGNAAREALFLPARDGPHRVVAESKANRTVCNSVSAARQSSARCCSSSALARIRIESPETIESRAWPKQGSGGQTRWQPRRWPDCWRKIATTFMVGCSLGEWSGNEKSLPHNCRRRSPLLLLPIVINYG